jgi:hypothetical protein
MPVIEAQCASILVPHDHRHINQIRIPVCRVGYAWPPERSAINLASIAVARRVRSADSLTV